MITMLLDLLVKTYAVFLFLRKELSMRGYVSLTGHQPADIFWGKIWSMHESEAQDMVLAFDVLTPKLLRLNFMFE